MKELEEKAKKICELKDALICQVKPYVDAGVFCETVDGMAVGQVVDMIKDLCDAEKNLFKGAYYKSVVKAMKEAEEEEKMMEKLGYNKMDRAGYDNWRYSSGRFAPTGKGHYAGYMPPEMNRYPYFDNPVARNEEVLQDRMGMLGYSNGGNTANSSNQGGGSRGGNASNSSGSSNMNRYSSSSSNSGGYSSSRRGRYGYPMDERRSEAYNDYEDAKRYYHESHDPEAKKDMEEHAKKHLKEVLDTTGEIWSGAKPETKKEFKEEMMKLLKDLPA